MSNVEVRKVTRLVGETGVGVDPVREDVVYEVGAVIDGTFVRFTTFDQQHVDAAQQRADAGFYGDTGAQQAAPDQTAGQEQTGTNPPDENTPASAASTSTNTQ